MDQGGDRVGLHRNEAISAVQDEEQFYGEEDDYDDLYNDVNVGEGFHQNLQRSDEHGRLQREEEKRNEAPPPPPPPIQPVEPLERVQIPGIAGEQKIERPVDRSDGFQDGGFRGSGEAVGVRAAMLPLPSPAQMPAGGSWTDLGQVTGRPNQMQGHNDGVRVVETEEGDLARHRRTRPHQDHLQDPRRDR